MKTKILAFFLATALVGTVLAGCGGSSGQSGQTASSSTSSSAASSSGEEPGVGMPNPWSDVATSDEAAAGAGLDHFMLVEDLQLSIGEEFNRVYRCMDGIAEADLEYAAAEITVRKGRSSEGEDISGDYGEYTYSWTQNIKGLEVNCYGNREGAASKTIWTVEDSSYSITAMGMGGDVDFGLTADDLNSIINGLQ